MLSAPDVELVEGEADLAADPEAPAPADVARDTAFPAALATREEAAAVPAATAVAREEPPDATALAAVARPVDVAAAALTDELAAVLKTTPVAAFAADARPFVAAVKTFPACVAAALPKPVSVDTTGLCALMVASEDASRMSVLNCIVVNEYLL